MASSEVPGLLDPVHQEVVLLEVRAGTPRPSPATPQPVAANATTSTATAQPGRRADAGQDRAVDRLQQPATSGDSCRRSVAAGQEHQRERRRHRQGHQQRRHDRQHVGQGQRPEERARRGRRGRRPAGTPGSRSGWRRRPRCGPRARRRARRGRPTADAPPRGSAGAGGRCSRRR